MTSTGVGTKVFVWIVTVPEAGMMGIAGFSKFANAALWTSLFEGWGYPGWFAPVIGASELVLAIALLAPRSAAYAATGLIVIMIGALVTVLLHPGGQMGPTPPVMHLVLLSIILAARWRVRWKPGHPMDALPNG